MSNLVHISDLVQAREMIQALTEKNAALKGAKEKWELTFEARVQTNNNKFNLVITAQAGKAGVIRTIQQDELLSFRGDYESLSDELAIDILVKIFEMQVKEELRRVFIPTARNIETMVDKFGSLI